MRLTINIEKRYAYVIIGLLAIGVIAFVVNAALPVPNPGHPVDSVAGAAINCLDDESAGGQIYENYCKQIDTWFSNVGGTFSESEKERAVALSSWSLISRYVAGDANVCYSNILSTEQGKPGKVPQTECAAGFKPIFKHYSRCDDDWNPIAVPETPGQEEDYYGNIQAVIPNCDVWFELCCK